MIEVQTGKARQFRVRPNRSLEPRGLTLVFGFIATGSLLGAGFFALQGLWVPLPLAVAELTAFVICVVRSAPCRALWWRLE